MWLSLVSDQHPNKVVPDRKLIHRGRLQRSKSSRSAVALQHPKQAYWQQGDRVKGVNRHEVVQGM